MGTRLIVCSAPTLMCSRLVLVGVDAEPSSPSRGLTARCAHAQRCCAGISPVLPRTRLQMLQVCSLLIAGLQLKPALGVSFHLCQLCVAKHMSKSLLPPGRSRAESQSSLLPRHLTFSARPELLFRTEHLFQMWLFSACVAALLPLLSCYTVKGWHELLKD